MTDIKSSGLQVLDERNTGVYIWMMPDGKIVQDEEGHFLSLPARKGDVRRANIMIDFIKKNFEEAREGRPVWVSNRQVSDEEYEHHLQRAAFGLTPDPVDDYVQGVKEGKIIA